MAHLSWYRKYRPQTFSDVVGQEHIERTLSNAVSEGTVSHLYLFTGPRGTGKTTTARILAKALNCEQGPTPKPDDTCDQCRAIADGVHPDVQELDAASRRGIDDVREQIIGRVSFAPSRGTWKVYIIDEVHMLTREAFNALLKTFEEPPPNTIFILATTDPHKVPETIHSRCQRFDFRRISVEDIVGRLRHIADAEGVDVPDGALTLIARHARGGLRDAIATLEQLASFGGGVIALDDVEGLLGEVDAELLFGATELIIERDVAAAFRLVARLAEEGIDMSEFVKGLVRHMRDLFVIAAVGADGAVDTTSEDLGRIESQAARLGAERTARVLDVLARLTTELRYAADQRLTVEVALTRMARPQADLTLEALAERLTALEAGAPIRETLAPPPVVPRPASRAKASKPVPAESSTPAGEADEDADAAEPPARPPAAAPGGGLDVAAVKRAWPAVLAEFKKVRPSRSHLFTGTEVELADGTLVIEFPADQAFAMKLAAEGDTLELLRRSIASVLGVEPAIESRLGRAGSSDGSRAVPVQAPVEPAEDVGPTVAEGSAPEAPAGLEAQVIAELGAEIIEDVTPES